MSTGKNTGINASREETRSEHIDTRINIKKPEILADTIAELIRRGVNVGGAFDAITAKAWRVWMTDAVSESFYSLSELFFYSGIDLVSDNAGTPFALNNSPSHGADKLFDGFNDYNVLEHGWVSEQIFEASSTNYIGKIFDEPVTVDRYGMAARTYNATTITEAPINFELQYSNDTTDGTDGTWFIADTQSNLAPWSLQGESIRHWIAQNTTTPAPEDTTPSLAIVSLDSSDPDAVVFSAILPEALAVDAYLRGYYIDDTEALIADTSVDGGYPAYITIAAGETTGSLTIDTTLSWLAGREVTVNLYTVEGDVPKHKVPTHNIEMQAVLDLLNANKSLVATIDDVAKSITLPSVSGHSSGDNVTADFEAQGLAYSLSFTRNKVGNWYDDDHTDADFMVEIAPVTKSNVVYDTGSWGYGRPNTAGAIRIYFGGGAAPLLVYGFTTLGINSTQFLSAYDGLTPLTVKLINDNGNTRLEFYTNDILCYTTSTNIPYFTTGAITFHHHNYSNSSVETLESIYLSNA